MAIKISGMTSIPSSLLSTDLFEIARIGVPNATYKATINQLMSYLLAQSPLNISIAGNAATVSTNANLSGPITSSGNVTSVGAQTGVGSTFVMQNTPTLTTPNIGVANGTSLSLSGQLTSTITTGTAPFVVSSTTAVANLKASTVTTNANLTGPITSVGNATSVAAQTGSGSTFVMDSSPTINSASLTSPVLITPNIGAAVGSSLLLLGQFSSAVATGTPPLIIDSTTRVANLNAATCGVADTVITNANLTGPIISTGNATSVVAQTGTGSTFVMQTSPNLTTPNIGVATGTSLSVSGQLISTVNTGTPPLVVTSTTEATNLKAATVTTNANLTGPITSVGNTTSVGSQTGTGSTFVMQNTPTLTTPNIGAATGTSLSVSGQLTSTVATGIAPLVVSSTTAVANLKAATVTTNANLTGPITSIGNATSVAAQTGTGSTFAMSIAPVLTTPTIIGGSLTGVTGVNLQTGTSYTFTNADFKYGYVTATNSSLQTYTIPQASTAVVAAGNWVRIKNTGTGSVQLAAQGTDVLVGNTLIGPGYSALIIKRIDGVPNTYDIITESSSNIQEFTLYIPTLQVITYYFTPFARFGGIITQISGGTRSGSATATMNISGASITMPTLNLGTSLTSSTATANNTFGVGNTVAIGIASNTAAIDVFLTVQYQRLS